MGNDLFEAVEKVANSVAKRFLTLLLTEEQKATVKKILGIEVPYAQIPLTPSISMRYGVIVPRKPPVGVNLKYGMSLGPAHPTRPPINLLYGICTPTAERLYLTDYQRQQITNATGCAPCNYVEFQRGVRLMYGLPVLPK